MTEILFYHLRGQTPEQVLPALLAKSLERGWRVVVQASSDERVEALDAHLWTWRDDAFLPHGTWREAEAWSARAPKSRFFSKRRSPPRFIDAFAGSGLRNLEGGVLRAEFHNPSLGPEPAWAAFGRDECAMAAVGRGKQLDIRILADGVRFEGRKRNKGIVLRGEDQSRLPNRGKDVHRA